MKKSIIISLLTLTSFLYGAESSFFSWQAILAIQGHCGTRTSYQKSKTN